MLSIREKKDVDLLILNSRGHNMLGGRLNVGKSKAIERDWIKRGFVS